MSTKEKSTTPQWQSSPPFYGYLGFALAALGEGSATIRLPYEAHLGNSRSEMHGGAVATLADAAMSQAVRSTVERGAAVATISLNVNYLAPARGQLTCNGKLTRGGRSVAFAEAEVFDESGTCVCRASATYRVLSPT
ncbi:MAG TPA: PaaI family thioesterase [Burkholderiales bacterium]|nr:PaaI family thioesterase [Burkholderiales bacterium]